MRKRFYVYLVIVIAIMITIFCFSAQPGDESSQISEGVLAWILSLTGSFMSDSAQAFLTEYIRKIAHFSIYCGLGLFTALMVRDWRLVHRGLVGDDDDVLSMRQTWSEMVGEQVFRGKTIGGLDNRPGSTLVSSGLGRDAGYHWNASLGDMTRPVMGSVLGLFGALCSLFICALYACTDEFHQYFVAGRSAEVRDVLIDSCGALCGILIIWIIAAIVGAVKDRVRN